MNRDFEKSIEITLDHVPKSYPAHESSEDTLITSSSQKLVGKDGKKLQSFDGVENVEGGKSSTLREYKMPSKTVEDVVSR